MGRVVRVVLLLVTLQCHIYGMIACKLRLLESGLVCVCDATYCDTLEFDLPTREGEILTVSSSVSGLRYLKTTSTFSGRATIINDKLSKSRHNTQQKQLWWKRHTEIKLNPSISFQEIVGFGGAFTGSVSHNLDNLDHTLRPEIYRSFYSKTKGNGYSMMRIPIGGCDFDLSPWAYNEMPLNDMNLSNFTKLDKRDIDKIEKIQDLQKISENDDIKFVGAAWSAPPWMKTNENWTGFGSLKPKYYQTWADYHIRYLELMEQKNIKFWAISTGNEPMNGVIGFLFVHFMSMGWLPYEQGQWVAHHLGPTLKKSIFKDTKILAGDDQRYSFPWWFRNMQLADKDAINFIHGFAVHWYWDTLISTKLLEETHEEFPDKVILVTEACSGDKPWEKHGPILGSWKRAEDYALNILQNLNNWVSGWIDWNLVLDERGGPNYANNFVDASIIANTTSGNEFYKQPIFYIMGHFSRFILPGSIRLELAIDSTSVYGVAFRRPDAYFVIVIYNKENHNMDIVINILSNRHLRLGIPAKSIHSILFK